MFSIDFLKLQSSGSSIDLLSSLFLSLKELIHDDIKLLLSKTTFFFELSFVSDDQLLVSVVSLDFILNDKGGCDHEENKGGDETNQETSHASSLNGWKLSVSIFGKVPLRSIFVFFSQTFDLRQCIFSCRIF